MKKLTIVVFLMFFLLSFPGAAAGLSSSTGPTTAAHYLVFRTQPGGEVLPIFHQLVELSAPLTSLPSEVMARSLTVPNRNAAFWTVHLQDADGRVVFQNIVQVPRWLRGEFHGEGPEGGIEGHFFPLETTHFVVRVPFVPGATLLLHEPDGGRGTAQFDLDALPLDRATPELAASRVVSSVTTGSPANRIDLLIMGDGYTGLQNADFMTDANDLANAFFTISPLLEYRNYFNVTRLYTESNESGADHPPYQATGCDPFDTTCCGDPDMQFDPLKNTFKDTAFDANYCSRNIHRLLEVDLGKVYSAAAAVPDWDTILLVVNDSTYGGSGGVVAVVSTNSAGVEIAQHEFGHSFANLADEYSTAYPSYPDCSDVTGFIPCETNVTDQTVRELIKWAPWILPSTSIPTIPPSPEVGLFEGARYKTTGMYRSGEDCAMRNLGNPFCPVPEQSFVLKMYEGGWGIPFDGIRMIEPGTMSPPPNNLQMAPGDQQTFSADVLSPIGGFAPTLVWYVDGVPVGAGSNAYQFTASTLDLGVITIAFEVIDQSGFVHPLMAGDALSHAVDWHVRVGETLFVPLITK
jgi:hypothetical protein